jgi:hypothetical protein
LPAAWGNLGEIKSVNRNQEMIQELVNPVAEAAHNTVVMDRSRILRSLQALDVALADHPLLAANPGLTANLRIIGGTAMVLRHGSRLGTTDIDAVIWPERGILEAADSIASREGLGLGWLNDAARRFLPERAEFVAYDSPVPLQRLALSLADDETLLAMKCNALRGAKDSEDIVVLAKALGMKSVDQLRDHTHRMYGRQVVDADAMAILEGVVHDRL